MPKGSGKPIPRVVIDLGPSPEQGAVLLAVLQERFEQYMHRHNDLAWTAILAKLEAQPQKVASLFAMEDTGGEPDVIAYDEDTGDYVFCDCSAESPLRRSICYDRAGEIMREKKGLFPGGNAVELAAAMGIELLDEAQYQLLQQLDAFDTKTESWLKTPVEIRDLGGALFGNRRYNRVFVGHNGAQSFYAARGFRGLLRV